MTSPTTAPGSTRAVPVRFFINGKKVGEGRIEKTPGAVWSLAGETADVGIDAYSPVTDDCDPWNNAFSGTIHKIVVKHKHAAGTGGRALQ